MIDWGSNKAIIQILTLQEGQVFVRSNQGPMQSRWNMCPHFSLRPFFSTVLVTLASSSSWQIEHSATLSTFSSWFISMLVAGVNPLWPASDYMRLMIPPFGDSKDWAKDSAMVKMFGAIGEKGALKAWNWGMPNWKIVCVKLRGNGWLFCMFYGACVLLLGCGLFDGIWYTWNEDCRLLWVEESTSSIAEHEQTTQASVSAGP